MIKLYDYQEAAKRDIYDAWSKARFAMAVLPTGAGKTVIFADILREHKGASVAIAHRQELVSQISLALAKDEVRHNILAPKSVVRLCVKIHMEEVGRSYFDPSGKCTVAGVKTLLSRAERLPDFLRNVTLWVMDEGHHVLKGNTWGNAVHLFPNAKGLGVTATPARADGKGLGAWSDGVFEDLIKGPSMRLLIHRGFLTDYRIFAPPSDIDLSTVDVSKNTGDYVAAKLKKAVRSSHVVGDVVDHYKRIANGKLGVTFATDVETAGDIAQQFNDAGIPAAVVTAKTPDGKRVETIRRFRNRQLLQLVNVDIFGEGFDLPAIEVVSMARPTQSYPLYVQQFGRALRTMDGKPYGIIIDHVGNVMRHGLPDAPQDWNLERRDRKSRAKGDLEGSVKTCVECMAVFARFKRSCPFCGHTPKIVERSKPEQVDGDLQELTPEALAALRGRIAEADLPFRAYRERLEANRVPEIGIRRLLNLHAKHQTAQTDLRAAMLRWADERLRRGRSVSELQRIFYLKYGIDVATAQTLKWKDAQALTERIGS